MLQKNTLKTLDKKVSQPQEDNKTKCVKCVHACLTRRGGNNKKRRNGKCVCKNKAGKFEEKISMNVLLYKSDL